MITHIQGKGVIQVNFTNAGSGDVWTMPEARRIQSILLTNVDDADYVTIREASPGEPIVAVLPGNAGFLVNHYNKLRVKWDECSLTDKATAVLSILLE